MAKLDARFLLFVAGILMAANGLIGLVINWVVGKGPVDGLIWGALTLLGLIMTAMTWRQVLQLLMQPRQRRNSDG